MHPDPEASVTLRYAEHGPRRAVVRPIRREREHGLEPTIGGEGMQQPVQCAPMEPQCCSISDVAGQAPFDRA
jgi:hypothetical protein